MSIQSLSSIVNTDTFFPNSRSFSITSGKSIYVSTSISLTIQIPYAIFQYKNAPYQPDSGVVLLKFLRGNNNYCKIYVYKNFSDIKESIPGVFINYDKQKYIDIHKTCKYPYENSNHDYIQ